MSNIVIESRNSPKARGRNKSVTISESHKAELAKISFINDNLDKFNPNNKYSSMNFMQFALDYSKHHLSKAQKNSERYASSFNFEYLPRTRNTIQKLPSLHYTSSSNNLNSNSMHDPKISEIFDTYVESKYLSKQNYWIDFNEFMRLPFKHRLPEIYFDFIYYVAKHKIADKLEENSSYYNQLDRLYSNETLESKGNHGTYSNNYKPEWMDDISYIRVQIDNLIANKEVKL